MKCVVYFIMVVGLVVLVVGCQRFFGGLNYVVLLLVMLMMLVNFGVLQLLDLNVLVNMVVIDLLQVDGGIGFVVGVVNILLVNVQQVGWMDLLGGWKFVLGVDNCMVFMMLMIWLGGYWVNIRGCVMFVLFGIFVWDFIGNQVVLKDGVGQVVVQFYFSEVG